MFGSDLWWILGNFAVGVVLLAVALLSSMDVLRERTPSEGLRALTTLVEVARSPEFELD